MSASAASRESMADALRGCLIDGKPVGVFAVAPNTVTGPSIVLEPHDPMLTRKTGTRLTHFMDATCIVPNPAGLNGHEVQLERLETLGEWVLSHWQFCEPASAPVTGTYAKAPILFLTVPLSNLIALETE